MGKISKIISTFLCRVVSIFVIKQNHLEQESHILAYSIVLLFNINIYVKYQYIGSFFQINTWHGSFAVSKFVIRYNYIEETFGIKEIRIPLNYFSGKKITYIRMILNIYAEFTGWYPNLSYEFITLIDDDYGENQFLFKNKNLNL